MFLFSLINYSWSICCNFCHRFSPSFCWIIDVPFPFLGIQQALTQSGCITRTQEHFCVYSSTKGHECQKGCDLFPLFPHLDRRYEIQDLAKWVAQKTQQPFHKVKRFTLIYTVGNTLSWIRHMWVFSDKWQWHKGHLGSTEVEESPW